MSLPAFSLSFDYRCPFAKNLHLHVIHALRGGADFDVTFAPWTLSQGHKDEAEADVWENPLYEPDLLALAYGVSVRDQQPEHFLDVHEALFRARHERGIRLVTHDEIATALADVTVDLDRVRDDVASRRPNQVIAETYRAFGKLQAFGVPTFVIGNDATFVRYMRPPTGDAATSEAIVRSLVTLMVHSPDVNEFKHTQLPA